MNDERKKILYRYAKEVNIKVEYRFIKAANEMIKQFGSFTTEDYDLFTKYVEHEQTKQRETVQNTSGA
jgi:hypothetical protein